MHINSNQYPDGIGPSILEWRDVQEYEKYYRISNYGDVKSLERYIHHPTSGKTLIKERILKKSLDSRGYLSLSLNKNGIRKSGMIHVMVAIAFHDHIPDKNKIVVDHNNNIKIDNYHLNIQLISHRKNSSKDKKGFSSRHTGVHWLSDKKRWRSRIMINGKEKHLGTFVNEEDAAKAYQDELKKLK